MKMGGLRVEVLAFLVVLTCSPLTAEIEVQLQKRSEDECALFKDPNLSFVKEEGPSYIKLDTYDFTGDLEVSFWMLPDQKYHNGPLFNMGSEDNFRYYEWKTKAVNQQFFVVEITYGALALLTKVLDKEHLHQLEMFTTYPTPYNIIDGHWQFIRATRENAIWTLSLNNTITKDEAVVTESDVNLWGRHAFLGGRPDYTDNVFRGIIKDLRVNGERVSLSGREMAGNAEVHDCDSSEVRQFAAELLEGENDSYEFYDEEPDLFYKENGNFYRYYDDNPKENIFKKGRKGKKGKGRKTQGGMTWEKDRKEDTYQQPPLYF